MRNNIYFTQIKDCKSFIQKHSQKSQEISGNLGDILTSVTIGNYPFLSNIFEIADVDTPSWAGTCQLSDYMLQRN